MPSHDAWHVATIERINGADSRVQWIDLYRGQHQTPRHVPSTIHVTGQTQGFSLFSLASWAGWAYVIFLFLLFSSV